MNTDLNKIYSDGTYLRDNKTWHVEDSFWKARKIVDLIRKNSIEVNRIADIGCGVGGVLQALRDIGMSAVMHGYEPARDAFERCNSRDGRMKFYNSGLPEADQNYDLLLCIDVFEHVDDYIGFIRSIRTLAETKIFHIPLDVSISSLLRGGLMRARRNLGHLHYFTHESAVETLRYCGYEIIDTQFTAPFERNGLPPKSTRESMLRIPRRIMYEISPVVLSRTIGGCSLLVMAK
jgi:SAM-dependent methyltransferase